jgi:5-(carboxyamino)imidazole ribonucleotide synthase
MILPGSTLGILGGGQLGRMFTAAARTLGYHVIVLDPDPHSPAAHFADRHIVADFSDQHALEAFGKECAAISTEFENAPAQSLRFLAQFCTVRPGAEAVAISQNRISEKQFFTTHGFPCARYAVIQSRDDIAPAIHQIGLPAIIKRSQLGYDGKGQARVNTTDEALRAFDDMGAVPCVLEELVPLQLEISVILARGADAQTAVFPVAENQHCNGILDVTLAPARIPDNLAEQARHIATQLAERLDYCGVLAVEFFVVAGGRLLINEIAPRPHNSGHYTLNACMTDQFEQQVRTLCGLPLGDARLLSSAVMVNLLGDLWDASVPPLQKIGEHVLTCPQAKLHLYGKREARPGRKMGHYTVMDAKIEHALALALDIKSTL